MFSNSVGIKTGVLSCINVHLKYFAIPLIVGILLIGCGGGGGSGANPSSSGNVVSASVSTGDSYGSSVTGDRADYTVTVSDDTIIGARLLGLNYVTDSYNRTLLSPVCKSFTDLGGGTYTLNECTKKPLFVTAVGGFIDVNGNKILDINEATQDAPLIMSTTVLTDTVLSVNPLATLAAGYSTVSGTSFSTLATKLGFADRVQAFRASSVNQPMNRMVNAVLSSAENSGFDIKVFSADLAARIVASPYVGVAALKGAITELANASISETTYGKAKVQSFLHDSRVKAVLDGSDAMSAMVNQKVTDGNLRIAGLVTTNPTGSNVVGGATVEMFLGNIKLATTVSDNDGKYSIEIQESSVPTNSTLHLTAQFGNLKLTSSIATNVLLKKRVNGNINANHSGSLALSPLTTSIDEYTKAPMIAPCGTNQYYRLQTKECLPLENPTWGFQGFTIPADNVYPLLECTQKALQNLLDYIPKEGGKVVMPACTINVTNGIKVYDNVILEGSGIGKTILSNVAAPSTALVNAVNLRGENIIVRNFTANGNGSTLNGIDGYTVKGNVLVEFIETKNVSKVQGSGIQLHPEFALENSRFTVRYNKSDGGLHGIGVKVRTVANMLIYSNEAYGNINYGIDMSTSDNIEVAGNYLHHNAVAGAKSPSANNIIYHHNNINYNGAGGTGAGLVYMSPNPIATITVKENDLSNNIGQAFACWNADFYKLILTNNNVAGSTDINGYNIGGAGVKIIDVTGNHGKIWTDGLTSIVYH